jgi:hypothetical protein
MISTNVMISAAATLLQIPGGCILAGLSIEHPDPYMGAVGK